MRPVLLPLLVFGARRLVLVFAAVILVVLAPSGSAPRGERMVSVKARNLRSRPPRRGTRAGLGLRSARWSAASFEDPIDIASMTIEQRERFKRRLLAQNPDLVEKYRKLASDEE